MKTDLSVVASGTRHAKYVYNLYKTEKQIFIDRPKIDFKR